MIKKGQIVEIPAESEIYRAEAPAFHSKRDELVWKAARKPYSLFDGFLVGEHDGAGRFRLGQRKGINVGGKKEPLYVIGIDEGDNRIFVGAGSEHPGLLTQVVRLGQQTDSFDDFSCSEDALQHGVQISFVSAACDGEIAARLYRFDGDYFLEFDRLVPITIAENPFVVRLK